MGRTLFDRAFREYSTRWRFKHPTPYDFFRTMEESSGIDLDWFWRGWFYGTDHVDIALDKIARGRVDSGNPDREAAFRRSVRSGEPASLTAARNSEPTVVERDPATRDFYNQSDPLTVTAAERRKAAGADADLNAEERAARATSDNFYRFNFRNIGGLVMPVILKMDFTDGSTETARIPAEVWRYNPKAVTWQYVTPRTLARAELAPLWETADADRSNNVYSGRIEPLTLELESASETQTRMKDSDLKVTPDSTRTLPALVKK
jgi:aminopeptidase N